MNIFRTSILCLAFVLSGCDSDTSQTEALARLDTKTPILVFGDSLSAGYNIQKGKEWPVLFEQELKTLYWIRPDQEVANYSKSGETTTGGLARLEDALNETSPKIVILELGANDALRRSSVDVMEKNLIKMIEMCRSRDILVVLVGVDLPQKLFFVPTKQFTGVYKKLDDIEGVVLVENLLDGVNSTSSMMQEDMLHPNESGQLTIMENVKPGLEEALEEMP